MEAKMIRNIIYVGVALALMILIVETSYSIDYWNLADQSSYRCPGGIVALGDLDRSVREKCGDPLEITRREDTGPIWIYHFGQSRFMYYFGFSFGKLQRIVSRACDSGDPNCYDLR
jgi:hypothetical protein